MTTTCLSLLDRIKGDRSSEHWQKFLDGYAPMIQRWLRKQGVGEHDSEEILQDVWSVLVRKLPEFERQRTGSFRRWLRLTMTNCLRDFWKRSRRQAKGNADPKVDLLLNALADDGSPLSHQWDQEHNQQLLALLLDRIQSEFRASTFRAFSLVTLEQIAPETVADELGMTTNAVFVAKSKVMKRLREEGAGMLDS